jgi:hypothetical protein
VTVTVYVSLRAVDNLKMILAYTGGHRRLGAE